MPDTHRTITAALVAAILLVTAPASAMAAESSGRTGIDGAAEALRNELEPSLLTFETMQKERGAHRSIDISNARVQGLQDVMYDGNPVRPTITLKLEKETLVEGSDFDVVFGGDIVNPGNVPVTVVGKGAYTGSIQTGFTILPGDLAYATIDVIADQKATGEELQPAPTVELEGKTLTEGVDYTVAYSDNIEEGTASVVVTGIGNCAGQQHASFEVLEEEDEADAFYAALPFVAGPAAIAAIALGIVAFTLARRNKEGAR
ncbi:MAG: hypothetical protein Q4B69_00295 [Slackia sp.]|nr:hypothetical protein [Slackia sp.]